MISIIAAIGKNRELGKNNGLLFTIHEDMRYFKETTMGHPVLMGLRTFQSIGRPLPGRKNYVAAFDPAGLPEGVTPVTDLDEFLKSAAESEEEIFAIGGGMIYAASLPFAKNLYLTEIDASADADTFFPEFNPEDYRKAIIKKGSENGLEYVFAKYTKK